MELKDQILERIVERAALLFKKEAAELGENTKFSEDLNAKSMNYSQIVIQLEDDFGVEIAYMEFTRRKTLGEAAEYVAELCNSK